VIASFGHQVLFALFPLAMAFAGASDLTTMTIPNKLVAAMVAGFVLLAPLTGMDLPTFGMHWAAGGVVLVGAFLFFALGWIGGGDAKLAAAAALWLGWGHTLEFLTLTAVFGGALTLALLSFRQAVVPAFIIRQPWVRRLHDEKVGVPYGIALAVAGLAVYPDTIWLQVAIG
jgi:prepilin peptidase CpaA